MTHWKPAELKTSELRALADMRGWQFLDCCPLCSDKSFNPFFLGRDRCVLCRCADCGIVFLNPRPASSRYEPGWLQKRYLPKSIERGFFSPDLKPDLPRIYEKYRKIADMAAMLKPKEPVVDIGCGIGLSMLALKHKGIRSIGVEVDHEFLTFARDTLGLQVRYHDVTAEPLEQRTDVATMNSVLEHVEDPVGFLSAIRRNILAKPRFGRSGALALTVPNLMSLEFLRDGREWRVITGDHLWYFTEDSLAMVAKRAGFEVEHIQRESRAPQGLEIFHTYVHDILGVDRNTRGGIGMILR
ncbi:class I SAM-dependent methyltransferase [Rhodospirillaceae bacterium SYSU D60014]|uniref:class I SAM-dependent methyltransferase n=1 Tax=Virgifigura deserti TaxID=2268457 RepID=UPI000E66168F